MQDDRLDIKEEPSQVDYVNVQEEPSYDDRIYGKVGLLVDTHIDEEVRYRNGCDDLTR